MNVEASKGSPERKSEMKVTRAGNGYEIQGLTPSARGIIEDWLDGSPERGELKGRQTALIFEPWLNEYVESFLMSGFDSAPSEKKAAKQLLAIIP